MRRRGINYDTGFLPGDEISRKTFTPEAVRHDMAVIAGELYCDGVRVSGGDPARLETAARCAAEAGLEVWFAPFPVDLTPDELLPFFTDCAGRAEDVRGSGAEVVFVAGCEMTAFCHGFLPGPAYRERLETMATADVNWWISLWPVQQRFNEFLARVAGTVRERFGGPVTYASGPCEYVEWSPFDFVAVDAYRAAHNATTFRDELRERRAHGKPVAVIEFGTCPYRGAGELGGMAWNVPPDAVPDEDEQVRYFTELLDAFEEDGVDSAFWFTFAGFDRFGARDLGSYGVVRMLDATSWEPRKVFHAMAQAYREATASTADGTPQP